MGTSMPPYLAFHLKKVASLIPCLWQTSAVFAPASYALTIATICSSLNLLFFMAQLLATDPTHFWRSFHSSGQQHVPS
jgi:hypothetical protein